MSINTPPDILIVDDSSVARSIIERALKIDRLPVGNVYHAANGMEGLEVLRARKVDLVITDINMPLVTGLEMTERMSKTTALRSVPVIVVSSNPSGEMPQAGAARVLYKPFTPESLLKLVREVLGKL